MSLVIMILMMTLVELGQPSIYPRSSLSLFEHSYLADMTNSYLIMDRMQYFYDQKYFTHKCPIPMITEYLYLKSLR